VVVESGLADMIARAIETVSGGNVGLVVIVLGLTTAVLTNLVSNAAAASILTPIALGISVKLALDPVVLLGLVATCISLTFINPFSHQTNLITCGAMLPWPIGWNSVWNTSRTTTATSRAPEIATTQSIKDGPGCPLCRRRSSRCRQAIR